MGMNRVSQAHWKAQNRIRRIALVHPNEPRGLAKFHSNQPYPRDEHEAWQVIYESIGVVDREIRGCNKLLESIRCEPFAVEGIAGANDVELIARDYIKTAGWKPSDARVQIRDVHHIIESLGGVNLYGSDRDNSIDIVVRELVQNARDAIKARQHLQPGKVFDKTVHIQAGEENGRLYLEVRDEGIGMTEETMKQALLSFGSSYWASDLAKREHPGLLSSRFRSAGRFGIGFYSIFMVASQVTVTSRPAVPVADGGRNRHANYVEIDFPRGLTTTPIIAERAEAGQDYSTCVRVYIDPEKCSWDGKEKMIGERKIHYAAELPRIVCGLDVEVDYQELGADQPLLIHEDINEIAKPENLAKRERWLADLYGDEYKALAPYLIPLSREDGSLRGLVTFGPSSEGGRNCHITIDGFVSTWAWEALFGFYADDESHIASRESYVHDRSLPVNRALTMNQLIEEPRYIENVWVGETSLYERLFAKYADDFRDPPLVSLHVLLATAGIDPTRLATVPLLDPDKETLCPYTYPELFDMMKQGYSIVDCHDNSRDYEFYHRGYTETPSYQEYVDEVCKNKDLYSLNRLDLLFRGLGGASQGCAPIYCLARLAAEENLELESEEVYEHKDEYGRVTRTYCRYSLTTPDNN